MHLKRQEMPKNWPVKRKGTKYAVRTGFGEGKSIPLLIVLRDILGLAQNRKEVRMALHQKNIFVNAKPARDEKSILVLFDTIAILPMKKHYALGLSSKGQFDLKEISEKESLRKISKIIGKKILKGKKTQLNLSDGRNFLSDINCKVGDSVIINMKENKIEECIQLKEKTKFVVFSGKHAGKTGIISKVSDDRRTVEVDFGRGNINVLTKQLMAVK